MEPPHSASAMMVGQRSNSVCGVHTGPEHAGTDGGAASECGTRGADERGEEMQWRAVIEYEGTYFAGYQRQGKVEHQMLRGSNGEEKPAPRTVQGELEAALQGISGRDIAVMCAGRTDKGVHASGQVITFKFPEWAHGCRRMVQAMNRVLPKDVAVLKVDRVPALFHPRFSASFRRYEYTIYSAPMRSPLLERSTWHVRETLDPVLMQAAASLLEGEHDFSTFGVSPEKGGHCIREIISIKIHVQSPSLIVVDIKGRAFLYHMVRLIVGALRLIGSGREPPESILERLEMKDRLKCLGKLAPSTGLVLAEVGFWGEDGGLSWEEWSTTRRKHTPSRPSERLCRDQNGNLIADTSEE